MDISLLLPLVIAAALGGVIGLEREIQDKPAGLRTNLLIAVGSAVFMMLSSSIASIAGGDPTRIAAQIITGIGFIGAGAILYSKGSVIGLTTAATIWVVAGIGMAVGSNHYPLAIMATALVLATLLLLGRLEHRLELKQELRAYSIRIRGIENVRRVFEAVFEELEVTPERIRFLREDDRYRVTFVLETTGEVNRALAGKFLDTEGVEEFSEETE